VRVYLPVDRDVLREAHGEGMAGGTETILVVDDDVDQRELIGRGLRSLGYPARVVVSGEEAVAYLSRRDADLVILDMAMPPGIDGAETYRRILQARPGQRAIVLSGSAESDRTRAALALGAGAYLRKPVTLATLARAVRRELDRV
ncbi:MAG: response regulator, partial [Chloroflexota bacterium]